MIILILFQMLKYPPQTKPKLNETDETTVLIR